MINPKQGVVTIVSQPSSPVVSRGLPTTRARRAPISLQDYVRDDPALQLSARALGLDYHLSMRIWILLHHFQPDVLLEQRINTFSFIAGDARQFFRMANIAALTLLRELPDFSESLIALINVFPALLVSVIPAQGPLSIIDYVKSNCQIFLEGKWQV